MPEGSTASGAVLRVRVVRALVLAVAVVDVFATAVVGYTLVQSWSQHRERAVVATQNLGALLEQQLAGIIDKVDLGLLAVCDEYAHELAMGGIREPTFRAFIARHQSRVPELEAIRTTDAAGELQLGDGITPEARASLADRPYFEQVRRPGAGLVISKPVVRKLHGAPAILLLRALRRPDGSFAGAAVAALTLDRIDQVFSGLDLGRHGVIALRDADLGIIVRHHAGGVTFPLGSRIVSDEMRAFVGRGQASATYTGVAVDRVERTITYRKVATYPFYLVVGLATSDILAGWWREVIVGLSMLVVFLVITAGAAWLAHRSWLRREAAIAEQRDLQARMLISERMASVGTLAAGVAHEVNNPLTYVFSNVAFAMEQLRASELDWSNRPACAPLRDAATALGEALAGAGRVRDIVRDLKTFSRSGDDLAGVAAPNAVIEGCLKMTKVITSRARVVTRLGDVPAVHGSAARLAQVLSNLLVNAAQAIPEGQPDPEIAVSTWRTAGGWAAIEVRDNGAGIPPDVLPHIFDPFFTTKPVGEGTGLGLSICHGIVEALGGEIRVHTEVERGTTFRMLLPPANAGSQQRPAAERRAARTVPTEAESS
ncbi:MAG TPA: ATP-binding protein [Anaeromyxobacteraceae bacterium]|nr:ATP-binding protein [Anaeromyxobacteraceae bacterium]